MQYLWGLGDSTLTKKPIDHPILWVDILHAIHPDMKSRSGIFMTSGKCATFTAYSKQKLMNGSNTWWNGQGTVDQTLFSWPPKVCMYQQHQRTT